MPFSSRATALATGSIGLAALAVVFLVMTPARQAAPVAVSATTSPSVEPAAEGDSTATIVAARRSDTVAPVASGQPVRTALATPIGSGQYALVLRTSLGDTDAMPDLILPSGRVTSGEVMADAGDTVLVHLDDHEPGHEVADHRPHDRDMVKVMTEPPVEVTLADLDRVDVVDGTPVVNAEGHLIGLCSERAGGGTQLVEVPAELTTPADP